MKSLTAYNESNEREIGMMVRKAACAFVNAENIKSNAERYIADYGHEEYRVAVQACMSEYEATIRIIGMFVKEILYGIQRYAIAEAEKMMA